MKHKEDVLLLCLLALCSDVLIYYYSFTVEQSYLHDLRECCLYLDDLKGQLKLQRSRTKLIFVRRNTDYAVFGADNVFSQ